MQSQTSEGKRKLKPSEYNQVYERLINYEQRKQQAIQMLQEAKMKEE